MSALRRARKARGWTQEDLADRVGVNRSAIIRWEKGSHLPSWESAKKLSTVLSVPAEQLFGVGSKEEVEMSNGNMTVGRLVEKLSMLPDSWEVQLETGVADAEPLRQIVIHMHPSGGDVTLSTSPGVG